MSANENNKIDPRASVPADFSDAAETPRVIPQAIVAVFDTPSAAEKALQSIEQQGLRISPVHSQSTVSAATDETTREMVSELRTLFYGDAEHVSGTDVLNGIIQGGAIGGASGLVFFAVPVLNFLAPIGGFLGGALIGGMAGIDEANRRIELPSLEDYRKMVRDGRGLVLIFEEEPERRRLENEFVAAGAIAVHQHPPIGHLIHDSLKAHEDEQTSVSNTAGTNTTGTNTAGTNTKGTQT